MSPSRSWHSFQVPYRESKMICSKLFMLLLLVGASCAAPVTKEEESEDEKIVIPKTIFDDEFSIYKGKHDIVDILVPMNSFNFKHNSELEEIGDFDDNNIVIFFVEADIDAHGKRDDKGLFVFKKGEVTQLLEHGRAAAASSDESTDIFFAAKDGIYVYSNEENKAIKYGSVTDDIIAIAKENGTDVIYYVNKDHELYVVTENGQKATKVEGVEGALEIVLDFNNNLYYFTEDRKVYVKTPTGLKKIEGLPENLTNGKLIKPPFLEDDVAVFLVDNDFYVLHANGTAEFSDFAVAPDAKPTAYAMEATVFQYYAYQKHIYKYNLMKLVLNDLFKDLSKLLEENEQKLENASPVKKSIKKH
ncbi:uncharacterized protein [Battus philenor]|uniref:uncharacterized protein n=1 Tax=Battus philenor TaxID=42288 RepID=UPI0035D0F764